jgi:hypothetical protein
MRLWPFSRKPNPLDRAEKAAASRLDCQAVGRVRDLKAEATLNGLLAKLDPDAADEIRAKLARAQAESHHSEVLRARGSA